MDLQRYRKVRGFFAKAILQIMWWDVLLNRPGLSWLRTPPLARWNDIARRYRILAIEMGGVLIKLGQFLSTRVDILPREVTQELAGLQDEVPPVPLAEVVAQIEHDFGQPLAKMFTWLSPQPLGAASLAQAHRARLASGEEVVVKILRPGIEILVETDLAAISLALRWLKLYRRLSSRVNLDLLAEEFTTITRRELDFANEGRNAERFAKDFAHDPQVYIPKIYWAYSASHTLTLENVGYIKINDVATLEAVGISRAAVAQKFFQIYMTQYFITNFVHSDPHPGNVFVKPLPHPTEPAGTTFAPGETVPYKAERPFQIAFVDFGMMVIVPERLRAGAREYMMALGTRDAYRVVQSYVKAGVLLPGADLKRLEEVHEAFFERFWGVQISKLQEKAFEQSDHFLHEYRDIVYDAPFQFPTDMLFVMRAAGLLAGITTSLNPEFNLWAETMPFAERLAKDELRENWRGWVEEAANWGQLALNLPKRVDHVLTQAQRGNLLIQTALTPDTRKLVQRLERSIHHLSGTVLAVGLLIAGVLAGSQTWLGAGLIVGAVVVWVWWW